MFESVGRGVRDVALVDLEKIGKLLLKVVERGGISCQDVDAPPLRKGLSDHESSNTARSSDHSDLHDTERDESRAQISVVETKTKRKSGVMAW